MARPPMPMMNMDEGADQSDQTICSIVKKPDGTYIVYAGDEPEPEMGEGGPGEVEGAGAEPAPEASAEGEPQGQPARSIGEVLNAVHSILQQDQDQGGTEESAFNQAVGGREALPQGGM